MTGWYGQEGEKGGSTLPEGRLLNDTDFLHGQTRYPEPGLDVFVFHAFQLSLVEPHLAEALELQFLAHLLELVQKTISVFWTRWRRGPRDRQSSPSALERRWIMLLRSVNEMPFFLARIRFAAAMR